MYNKTITRFGFCDIRNNQVWVSVISQQYYQYIMGDVQMAKILAGVTMLRA